SRPIPSELISAACTIPSGSIMNVPRCAKPFSSSSTSKPLEIACDGSPIITYSILLIASEWSCQALCTKCVSVDTEETSAPSSFNVWYCSCRSSNSVGHTNEKSGGENNTTAQLPFKSLSVTSVDSRVELLCASADSAAS